MPSRSADESDPTAAVVNPVRGRSVFARRKDMLGCAMPDFSLFGDEHVRKYEETDGQIGHDWNNTQILILRTTGRTSGELRKVPLIYGESGGDYLIVASKGGAPEHPGWYKNLLAHPDVEVQVRGEVKPVTARTASTAEKAKLWSIMTKEWPDYDAYQQKTERDIPLVILHPRAS